MVEIIFSDFSIEDINGIAEYIAMDSPFYASKFIDGIFERVYQLEEFPDSGKVTPESENENIRELNYGNYRIIYEVMGKNQIAVLRVLHGARNISSEDFII